MAWQTLAKGSSFEDLQMVMEDRQLPVGTKLKGYLDVSWWNGWVFDFTGAEQLVQAKVPDGIKVTEVRYENGRGEVFMEVVPPGTVGFAISGTVIISYIAAHWGAILISGIVLAAIVIGITILVKLEQFLGGLPPWIIFAGVGALVLLWLRGRSPPRLAKRSSA